MPAVAQWESYFNVAGVLDSLGCRKVVGDAIEFGCGYGTFTNPLAQRTVGRVFALDVDPLMVTATTERALQAGLKSIFFEQRDFVAQGCGRESESASKEARRVLHPRGVVGVIHWNYDARTPRGPPLDIRPSPEQCRAWGEQAGLRWVREQDLPGSPWHWGMVFEK